MKKKRVISILLSLTLLLGLMSGMTVFADSEPVLYDVWVGGTRVTSVYLYDTGWKYSPNTETLTLDNYDNHGAVYQFAPGNVASAAIYAEQSITIEIKGTNNLTNSLTSEDSSVIRCTGNMTIIGTGTLNAQGGRNGITIFSNDERALVINGGNIIANGGNESRCHGIYVAGGMNINDGEVTANGGDCGILTLGDVNITNGNVTATGNGNASQGIYAQGNVTIDDGTVIALSTGERGQGIHVKGGDVSIYDGEVIARGDDSGIYASEGAVYIKNGTVTVNAPGNYGDGIRAKTSVTIEGGTVKASGNGEYSVGIFSFNDIIIKDGIIIASGREYATFGTVKNSIVGVGSMDVAGTMGKAAIPVSTDGQVLDYRYVKFPTTLSPATVTTEPKAKTLTYTGSAQELVTAGVASGGTMQYLLGTNEQNPPKTGWDTSIPKGTDAKTYYVWYKAAGDEDHLDSPLKCVTVTISKKEESSSTTETTTTTTTETTTTTTTTTQTTTTAPKTAVQQPSQQEKITISKAPKIKKLRSKKNKVQVTWNKIRKNKAGKKLIKQIKYIEIQAARDPEFQNIVATKNVGKKKSKTVLKLGRKTVYYVRVRYVGADGVSAWSKVKRIKTK